MALVNAVGILDRYSPAKKPLLSALPEVGEDVLLITAASARHWQQRMRYPQTRIA
ncbi:MAG: hypothetical protein V8S72_08760 [Oscillospiraceae bacterium]